MSRKIAIVCLWLLFCGSVIGEEPCEAPTAGDYANASRELEEHPQGFIQILNRANTIGSRAFIARYEACMKQQEADLRRERLKAEAEVLRAETEAIKAETEALKADQRRKELEAQSKALKNVVRKFPTRDLYGDADYQIDLGLVLDFEDIRELIEECRYLDRLEVIRAPLESATDLEQLRATLESYGIVEFYGCPSGETGSGIIELSRIGFVPQSEPLEKHFVVSTDMDTGRLVLDDGSIWKISPTDRVDSLLFEVITVTDSGNPMYPYKLINTDTEDVVEAKLLSQ